MPPVPDSSTTFTTDLYDAIAVASRYTDTENTRHSLGGIALRGSNGTIAAGDG